MEYALVTGGSRGIGKEVSLALARMGYCVLINYISNQDSAKETKEMIEKEGNKAELLPFDVSSKLSIDSALLKWSEEHPNDYISILVNNAGIRKDAVMIFMQDEQWEDVINTNLNSYFYVTRRVLKDMLTKRFGRIINIVSLSGIKGLPGQTNYSAAKAGVIGATKALAQEVAARNVTVNAVAPGFISTDMTKNLDEASLKKLIPIGRFGKPEEVASLVCFLSSKQSSYITGEVISINGGLYT
ncbi:MAG: fabG 1 [Bacteroidetes bacterium]|nr:fabG 1 [Bacteroidota bacterium]